MKFLIVGFGNMGCRHAQSLLSHFEDHNEYFVLEPNKEVFVKNLKIIGASNNQFIYFDSINNLPENIDFAIIATSAFPRYNIVRNLIAKGIKYYLLEKIVFQSEYQFTDIISLMKRNGCKGYCNFVNRYFPNYIEIKEELKKLIPIQMIVSGGDFGLGCNAIHYMDLFEYFTGEKIKLKEEKLIENQKGNRRGENYQELLGQVVFTTNNGSMLIISAEEARIGGNEIIIKQGNSFDILNEESKKHIHFSEQRGVIVKDFIIHYTSYLTNIIVHDIIHDSTLLPSVNETMNNHIELFKAANYAFGLNNNDLCPLT